MQQNFPHTHFRDSTYSELLFITRDDVVSQRLKFGSAFLSFSWESKIALFFNFPVSRARSEKLCDFYWLQPQITCKSGWIAQAEKRYCVCVTTQKDITPKGYMLLGYSVEEDKDSRLCSRSNGARLGLGRLKMLPRWPSRATCWCWFLYLQ